MPLGCGPTNRRLLPLALLHTTLRLRRHANNNPHGVKKRRIVCNMFSTDRHIASTLDAVPQGKHNVNW